MERKKFGYVEYFIEKDKRINNMEDVINSLNIFFYSKRVAGSCKKKKK